MRQCGFSVAAFILDLGRINIARGSAYGNYDFRIRSPSIDALEEDPILLPPKPVQKKAGRPKGKRERRRTNVIGEHSTSSQYNERTSALVGGVGAVLVDHPFRSRPSPSKPRRTHPAFRVFSVMMLC